MFENTSSKFSSGRQEIRPYLHNSIPYNIPESSVQNKVSTPAVRESQSSYTHKEYIDARNNIDYTSVWYQKHQPHQQQQQQQQQPFNQQMAWPSISNHLGYTENIPNTQCSNRTQAFPDSRPFYMQFNPYITQRAFIASHNQQQQQHSTEFHDAQINLRFPEYDYTLR